MKIIAAIKKRRRYLAKAGYGAFPKTLQSIGQGQTNPQAIAKDTGVPLFVVKAMVALGQGTDYVTKSEGKLVLTSDGKERIAKHPSRVDIRESGTQRLGRKPPRITPKTPRLRR